MDNTDDIIIQEPIDNNSNQPDLNQSIDNTNNIEDISCCVCFRELTNVQNIQTLTDIAQEDIKWDTIIKSACNKHYICIKCLHTIITDYTNHPINERNSHVYCPYPFEECLTIAGTKNIFEHNALLKILDEIEQSQYINHAERFSFPGYTLILCPCTFYVSHISHVCNYPVLIENELIISADIGDLVIQCHQNEHCCKLFCYHCRHEVHRYDRECRTCKLTSENSNPNILNRYIIKNEVIEQVPYNDEEYDQTKYFDETDYLYYNKEITVELALEHIKKLIEHNLLCICPVCKLHLFKTEKCNGMRHHNIERCYACGRIGSRIGGIANTHWNPDGIGGCFRFDYDRFVTKYIPEYLCNQSCQNHEHGDCSLPEHKLGIQKMEKIRKQATIYHCIKSLLPNIRYIVLDILYDTYINTPTAYELLPYKQTFAFLEIYSSDIIMDYCEETLYEHLNLHHPVTIPDFIHKNRVIDTQEYINNYVLPPPPPPPRTPRQLPSLPQDIQIQVPQLPPSPPPPPPPYEANDINVARENIQNTMIELENIFNRILHDEEQPLLETDITDISDILNSYIPLVDNISDTNTDADNILIDTPPLENELDNMNTDNTDNMDTDNITIYYNTNDIYIIGSDSDSDSDSDTEVEQEVTS